MKEHHYEHKSKRVGITRVNERFSHSRTRKANHASFASRNGHHLQHHKMSEEQEITRELAPEIDTFFSDLTGARPARKNKNASTNDSLIDSHSSLREAELPGEKVANTFSHNISTQQTQTAVM